MVNVMFCRRLYENRGGGGAGRGGRVVPRRGGVQVVQCSDGFRIPVHEHERWCAFRHSSRRVCPSGMCGVQKRVNQVISRKIRLLTFGLLPKQAL